MKIEFTFQYAQLTGRNLELYYRVNSEVDRRATYVNVFFNEIPHEGWSICSPKDNFVKSKGRKLAVTDAIKCLPRKDRKAIWESYFKMCKE